MANADVVGALVQSGAYRLDQPDDLTFLATFGITP